MKINGCGESEKTNPIQTQSNPISEKHKMNVSSVITKDYRKKDDFAVQKNKANSKPISEKPKMNVNLYVTKDYRKKDDFAVQKNKPNSNPISEKPKMNVNLYVIEDYENKPRQWQENRLNNFCS